MNNIIKLTEIPDYVVWDYFSWILHWKWKQEKISWKIISIKNWVMKIKLNKRW